jgi:hypothetical protein
MPVENIKDTKTTFVKHLYFYVVSFAALMMIAISSIVVVDTLLKMTVLSEADRWQTTFFVPGCEGNMMPHYGGDMMMPQSEKPTQEYCAQEKNRQMREEELRISRQQQRELSWSLSMLAVALPLFIIHWNQVRSKKD